jgi:hypothetical protein
MATMLRPMMLMLQAMAIMLRPVMLMLQAMATMLRPVMLMLQVLKTMMLSLQQQVAIATCLQRTPESFMPLIMAVVYMRAVAVVSVGCTVTTPSLSRRPHLMLWVKTAVGIIAELFSAKQMVAGQTTLT